MKGALPRYNYKCSVCGIPVVREVRGLKRISCFTCKEGRKKEYDRTHSGDKYKNKK